MMIDYQGQIDYMVKKFQDLTAKCEAMEKQQKENDKICQLTLQGQTGLKSLTTELDFFVHNNIEITQDSIKDLLKRIDMHDNATKSLGGLLQNLDKSHQEIVTQQNAMKWLIENIKSAFSDFATKEEFKTHKENLDKLKSNIDGWLSANAGANKAISETVESLNAKVGHFRTNLDNLGEVAKTGSGKINSLATEFKDFKIAVADMMEKSNMNLSNQIKDTISAIPKPIVPSIDEAKNAFIKQLEPVSLDAKNAHVRGQNNEMKINILEKKVEQLTLQLNQLKLGA